MHSSPNDYVLSQLGFKLVTKSNGLLVKVPQLKGSGEPNLEI